MPILVSFPPRTLSGNPHTKEPECASSGTSLLEATDAVAAVSPCALNDDQRRCSRRAPGTRLARISPDRSDRERSGGGRLARLLPALIAQTRRRPSVGPFR